MKSRNGEDAGAGIRAIRLGDSPGDIQRAAEILKNGGLAAFPTETVYGLGADAFNIRALARVFEAKGRPRFDPLIIHIASPDMLEGLADLGALSPRLRPLPAKLAAAFWPGPLTLVLPKRPEVPDLATAGLPTVAVRFPAHPAAQKLIALSSGAVAAPSANPFGRLSPTRASHVLESLGNKIDCVIDGGPCSVGVESTVLSLAGTGELPRILRPGGISREQLERVIGPAACGGAAEAPSEVLSPGMLKSHYAPKTPLTLHGPEEMSALPFLPGEGYLFFSETTRDTWLKRNAEKIPGEDLRRIRLKSPGNAPDDDVERIRLKSSGEDLKRIRLTSPAAGGPAADAGPAILVLSRRGDAVEAAARLFESLHLLDRAGLRRIHAEVLPPEGLGAAVNDRLRRAAGAFAC
ncbi:MAG: threonylcarbamoyl-AMP synthase [Treponema sp.]|jgi:L-threonylcarbamoyladenylate synthase|nr:threonylcarbamoyl-AMP synthase [Treponema sp.]